MKIKAENQPQTNDSNVCNGVTDEKKTGKFRAQARNPTTQGDHSMAQKPPVSSITDALTQVEKPTVSVPPDDRPKYNVYNYALTLKETDATLRPGVWLHGLIESKKGPEPFDRWICSPLHVDAYTHDGHQNNYGRLLRFTTEDGTERQWTMPKEMLADKGKEYRAELLSMGVDIDSNQHQSLQSYLSSRVPQEFIRCALQVGWLDDEFVLPDEIFGPNPDNVTFQAPTPHADEYTQAGTLEGWREKVSALAVDNPILVLAISAAFVGPLLSKCHAEGGGIHFVGDAASGKSTALEAARSVWGGRQYMKSWKATANGMEGTAALHNDGLLCLDEISECNPRDVGAIVYSIGNGIGKQRASRTGAARSVTRWLCFMISSGERTVATHMLEGGLKAKAGQSARLLDIPTSRTYGAWDELHSHRGGEALSDAIKQAAATHYGKAGRAFLRVLTEEERDFPALLKDIKASITPADAQSQEKRAATRFAIMALAGELATEYGLTGWAKGAAIEAAKIGFQSWSDFRGKGNDEAQKVVTQVREFIDLHGDSRFSHIEERYSSINNRAGWYRDEIKDREYLFHSAGMREALSGFDFKRALDVLEAKNIIPKTGADGKRARLHRINNRPTRLYEVSLTEAES